MLGLCQAFGGGGEGGGGKQMIRFDAQSTVTVMSG